MVLCNSYNLYFYMLMSANNLSDTESQSYPLASTLKIQAAQGGAEDSPAERPQVELSMCSVQVANSLVPRLNEWRVKPWNKAAHFLKV